jgi:ureidoglycolate lyase
MTDGIGLPARVTAMPLTADAFAAFGEVVVHSGGAPRRYLEVPFDHDAAAVRPRFWVTRIATGANLPLRIERLERHPYSAQTFIPLRAQGYLVVVAPSTARGFPDLGQVRAFVAKGTRA